jgi:hypothetical protein
MISVSTTKNIKFQKVFVHRKLIDERIIFIGYGDLKCWSLLNPSTKIYKIRKCILHQ